MIDPPVPPRDEVRALIAEWEFHAGHMSKARATTYAKCAKQLRAALRSAPVPSAETQGFAERFRAALSKMPRYWIQVTTTPEPRSVPAYMAADVERALGLAAPPIETQGGWQDISTAPKDGTCVLLWWPYWSKRPTIGYWKHSTWIAENALEGHAAAPTHWQPLPAPPISAAPSRPTREET